MISLDRFSQPMAWEYASKECPYCDDYPCTCYHIGQDDDEDRTIDSWDDFMTRVGY